VPTTIVPRSASSPYLASNFPASGGFGYRSISWSPDGHSIAAAISFGASGAIQIWNTQTDTVASTFQVSGSYVVGSVAWSSDGKYLAAHANNSQPTDMANQPPMDDHVLVWNVSTRQLVFQHTDGLLGGNAPVFWQPQSDNLTFVGMTHSGRDYLVTLEIWNVITGQQVKQFVRVGDTSMVWSPDGKDLAYSGAVGTGKNTVNAIIIIDASSGKQIYAYKAPPASVIMDGEPLAWSPDGKYIVSAQGGGMGFTDGKMTQVPGVAQVWVA
jgi:WD40 repeat protein